jgi:hypothetical protein
MRRTDATLVDTSSIVLLAANGLLTSIFLWRSDAPAVTMPNKLAALILVFAAVSTLLRMLRIHLLGEDKNG